MTLRLGDTIIAGSGANQDLSNLTSEGKNIANWSSNVTNCITEIPQDIKLELNNGTLTLKAGSKVYVPNGFESDGTTPKFDVVNITSDISTNYAGYPDYDNVFICLKTDGSFATYFKAGNQNSGSSGEAYSFTYRTDLNKIYDYEESTTNPYEQVSFPIGRFKYQNNGIAVIYQVFNGFGYIGSTAFALPGVKGLVPNGRNADGTLKNTECITDKVLTFTYTDGWANTWVFQLSAAGIGIVSASNYIESDNEPTNISGWTVWYNTKDNINYLKDIGAEGASWVRQDLCNNQVKFTTDSSGKITLFTPKTVFHALGYNDSSTISGWPMPSGRYMDLTLLASGSQYTAPANGWLFFSKRATAANQEVYIADINERFAWEDVCSVSGQYCQITVPWEKGHIYKVAYGLAGTTIAFRFIYAEGEN